MSKVVKRLFSAQLVFAASAACFRRRLRNAANSKANDFFFLFTVFDPVGSRADWPTLPAR